MSMGKLGKWAWLALLLLGLSAPAQNQKKEGAPALNLTSLDDVNDESVPTEALKTFVDVFDAVRANYVENVSSQRLMENAIRGMLSRLDPHSTYMNQQEYAEFEKQSEGNYAGIGVVLDMKAGSISVVAALEGSPAAKAGVQAGDIISQVNGQNVSELNLNEADKLLEGEVGSEVKLLVQRGDTMHNYAIKRELIHTNSVSSKMLSDNFAYIRISQFQSDTGELLKKEIEALRVKYQIRGIVLDLRNNPGGLLDGAIEVADHFLDKGVIVSSRGRNDNEIEKFEATPGDLLDGAAMVVLINAGSAAGAEVVAGALQDNNRALIAGQPSFGKGSVQTITPLYHGGALKLTTARYFTPAGKSIQAEGIKPQVLLNELRVQNNRSEGKNMRESALPYHLRSLGNETARPRSMDSGEGEVLAEQDFALYEALNLLTALDIFGTKEEAKDLVPVATATLAEEEKVPPLLPSHGETKAEAAKEAGQEAAREVSKASKKASEQKAGKREEPTRVGGSSAKDGEASTAAKGGDKANEPKSGEAPTTKGIEPKK